MTDWIEVESSAMSHVKHTAEGLHVRRPGGQEYVHKGVPKALHERLMASPSKGSFMHKHITPKYPGKLK